MGIQLRNNAVGFLTAPIGSSDTSITLQTGNGAKFPALGGSDYFYATLSGTDGSSEIVKATTRTGDTLTVVRAQEGTAVASFSIGSRIEMRVTAASVRDLVEEHDEAVEISVADVGGYFAATNVEGVLQEIGAGGGSFGAFTFVDNFTGNGTTTVFTLGRAPIAQNLIDVYINGVYQEKTSFSFLGTTLTFLVAPPLGAGVEVVTNANITSGAISSLNVLYDPATGPTTNVETRLRAYEDDGGSALIGFEPAGSGAVARPTQAKLRETVSVMDFGAVGDGVADDTAAVQAAIDSLPASTASGDPASYQTGGGTVYFPPGVYRISSPIVTTHNVTLDGAGVNAATIKAIGNIDVVQIAHKYAVVADYTIQNVNIKNLSIDGNAVAEAGITNRTPTGSNPIQYGVFENLRIIGCKVGMHFFGGWNNTFRKIFIRSADYNSATAEGIVGFIGETVTAGNTYGPAGHTVVAQSSAGGFNNNIFDTVVTLYMKRIGVHIRAISAAHSYSNQFINCNFEQIIKQASPQTYAPYTDTTATPEGLAAQTLRWSGQAVGLHLLGRISGFSITNNYLEAIVDEGSLEGGAGVYLDDCGITFGGGASKCFSNTIQANFFNSNVERIVAFGRSQQNTVQNNSVLLSAGANRGYLVESGSTDIHFIDEVIGNISTSSAGTYSFITAGGVATFNNAVRNIAQVSINTGSAAGIDLYRSGSTAMFDAIRFRDGTNANTLSKIGFNANTMRLDAVASYDYYINNTRVLFLDATRIFPNPDDTLSLGTVGNRWTTVYATTPTINTSDEREKQDIAELDDAEKRVAVAIKSLIKKFKFKSAVEKKGSDARIHVGVIAQEVKQAFEAEGLDAHEYGIFCYDEWDAEVDENGVEIKPAGNRYGVRYEELLAFVISAM
jgi:hypothetical protein